MSKSSCVLEKMDFLAKEPKHKDTPKKQLLALSYEYCEAHDFFMNLKPKTYDFLRKISIELANSGQEGYIINDAQVMSQVGKPGESFRVEPMKTLAEATGGKSSSDIKKIGYFNYMLELEFKQGDRYIYFVGPEFYDDFIKASDPDKYFWDNIRGKDIGLVFNYVYGGPYKRKKTPGGLGASIVPYARGSVTPEAQPKLPGDKERALIKKEIELGEARKGLKLTKPGEGAKDEGLKRAETAQELKHTFAKMKKDDPKKFKGDFGLSDEIQKKIKRLKRNIKDTKQFITLLKENDPPIEFSEEMIKIREQYLKEDKQELSELEKEFEEYQNFQDEIWSLQKEYRKLDDEWVSLVGTGWDSKGKISSKWDRQREIKNKLKELKEKGKGRGWWGESERHSYARRGGFKKDFDESKGRWVTIKGKHIFIPKGGKLTFGKDGKYKISGGSPKERILQKAEKLKKEKADKREARVREIMEEGNSREIAERIADDEKYKKTKQTKIPVKQKGTGERIEPYKEKKTQQTRIDEPSKDASVDELKKKKAEVKAKLKKDPKNKWLMELLEKLSKRIASRIAKGPKKDDFTVVNDNFQELIAWVKKELEVKDDEEAKEIAFAIIKSNKKKGGGSSTKKDKSKDKKEITREKSKPWEVTQHIKEKKATGTEWLPSIKKYEESEKTKSLKRGMKSMVEQLDKEKKAKSEPKIKIPDSKVDKYISKYEDERSSILAHNKDKHPSQRSPDVKDRLKELNEKIDKLKTQKLDKEMASEIKTQKEKRKEGVYSNLKQKIININKDIAKKIKSGASKAEIESLKKQRNKLIATYRAQYQSGREAYKKYKQNKISDMCGTLVNFGICDKRFKLVHDFYHANNDLLKTALEHKIKKNNVKVRNDTVLEGVITRAGPFTYYDDNGNKIIRYKKWDNIVDNIKNPENRMLPLFGSKDIGSHIERDDRLIGFVDGWNPDHNRQELRGKVHTFEPIEKLSDLRDPKDIQVSLSFYDNAPEDSINQNITRFRHVAMSLNNVELDNCSSVDGYGRCIVSPVVSDMHNAEMQNLITKTLKYRSSSPDKEEPRKIITDFQRGLIMPDDEDIKLNNIEQVIADFKEEIKEDSATTVTGNEVKGHTLKDKFMNVCLKHNNSPAACEKAWTSYNAENEGTKNVPEVSAETGGHVKETKEKSDFDERIQEHLKPLKEQLKQYEDYFKAKRQTEISDMKGFIKLAFGEDSHQLIDDLKEENLTIEDFYKVFKALYKEHEELLPIKDSAEEIQDMNTKEILKRMGKTQADMRNTEDELTMMEKDALAKMEDKWK